MLATVVLKAHALLPHSVAAVPTNMLSLHLSWWHHANALRVLPVVGVLCVISLILVIRFVVRFIFVIIVSQEFTFGVRNRESIKHTEENVVIIKFNSKSDLTLAMAAAAP